eukprot:1368163-Amphidinium_carterae.1
MQKQFLMQLNLCTFTITWHRLQRESQLVELASGHLAVDILEFAEGKWTPPKGHADFPMCRALPARTWVATTELEMQSQSRQKAVEVVPSSSQSTEDAEARAVAGFTSTGSSSQRPREQEWVITRALTEGQRVARWRMLGSKAIRALNLATHFRMVKAWMPMGSLEQMTMSLLPSRTRTVTGQAAVGGQCAPYRVIRVCGSRWVRQPYADPVPEASDLVGFGRYKNNCLKDVPTEYMQWAINTVKEAGEDTDPMLRRLVRYASTLPEFLAVEEHMIHDGQTEVATSEDEPM